MKEFTILMVLAVSSLVTQAQQNYSDVMIWTTADIESTKSIEDNLNTDSPVFVYTIRNFDVEQYADYDKEKKGNTPLLRSISNSKSAAGIVEDVIEVDRSSNTVIEAVKNWEELEKAFAEDLKPLNGAPYTMYIVEPEYARYTGNRVKRVSIKTEKQGRRKNQKTRLRTQSAGEEFKFPIFLPPYHKNEKYPVAKENPENYGNCLLYIEGVNVIMHASGERTPSYIDALVGNYENHRYAFNEEDVQCIAKSRHSTVAEDVRGEYSFDVTIKLAPEGVVGKYNAVPQFKVVDTITFKLIFNTTLPRSWELVKVDLSEITISPVSGSTFIREKMTLDQTVSAKPSFMRVYSTDPYCYACSTTEAVFFPLGVDGKTKYQVGIGLHNFQVQLYGLDRNEVKDTIKFTNNVNDCVPTFSSGSVMGLGVTIVLCFILLFAFLMLNSVQTQDRYDDPKQKTILINVRE